MINIELELVSDVNLDQALCTLARTLTAGRRTHRAGAWRLKSVLKHLQHARKHLDLLASGSEGEDHLAHAAGLGTPRANRPDQGCWPNLRRGRDRVRPDATFRRRGSNAANVNRAGSR
jgi:hypothetical protein